MSQAIKVKVWANSIPMLNEETCKKHFDELGVPELKGIFTKRNTATRSYIKTDEVTAILSELKNNTWIHEYYVAAEPPVRCGESHLSGQTEPPCY